MSNKTVNQALRDLYLAHGGDPSALEDNKSLSDFIDDISTVIGGGSSLPEVTTDDNGKALIVSNGAWGKGAIPTELPSVDTQGRDFGKVLMCGVDAWQKRDFPKILPDITAADDGKVLGVAIDDKDNPYWTLIDPTT